MALPVNVDKGTVVGKFIDSDGGAWVGTVTFTPSYDRLKDVTAGPPVSILPRPVQVSTTNGYIGPVHLVATDDTDLNPIGFTYEVSFKATGGSSAIGKFSISVPKTSYDPTYDAVTNFVGSPAVDLTLASPVGSSSGATIIMGPAGVGVPEGGDTGQVLVKASGADADTEWVDPPSGGGGSGTVTSVNTRTPVAGAITLIKGDLGLGNVDNTSDASKPVSALQAAADSAIAASVATLSSATSAALGTKADLSGGRLATGQVPTDLARTVNGVAVVGNAVTLGAENIAEGTTHKFLTPAERTSIGTVAGKITMPDLSGNAAAGFEIVWPCDSAGVYPSLPGGLASLWKVKWVGWLSPVDQGVSRSGDEWLKVPAP